MKKAIILCSGGLDSVVTAHFVKKKLNYSELVILFFDYGQKTFQKELEMSELCAKNLNADFRIMKIKELGSLSFSLINKPGKVEEISRQDLKDTKKESLKWYVPCRNLIFLSYALALAESDFSKDGKASDIFTGFKNDGKESFSDATSSFVDKMNSLSKEICNKEFKIFAPLIEKDKEDIILVGKKLNVDFTKTFSCYIGKEKHCGKCLACKLRQEGFYWAEVKDPTDYTR
jgi:7-cyano-7-deazaguanine synthase